MLRRARKRASTPKARRNAVPRPRSAPARRRPGRPSTRTGAGAKRQILPTPLTTRDPEFDLSAAYAVETEAARLRRTEGRTTVGRKVGYANKAVWRALKLETLVWAHMYDDTVRHAEGDAASLDISRMCAPKIEPEIVFKMRAPLYGESAAAVTAP